ncbi:hypothetical protein FRC03_003701 [Tulasnella sp. 419]|nr:hypothetical protein FRC03_003701 [Tulasnella sp. 419]
MIFSLKKCSLLLSALAALGSVHGHPEDEHEHMGAAELSARQLAANERHIRARACAPAMASMAAEAQKRRAVHVKRQGTTATLTGNTYKPSATAISGYTCITAPEVTEGPYYIRNEYVRQDIRDGQSGVPLKLDIGVIDTSNCQPLSNAYVELWHANATGFYGGFTSASTGGGGGGGGPGGGGGGGSSGMSDHNTFLRGGWPTNSAGLVEMVTVYPGYYTGRTTHIHMMVHTDWTMSSNGTIVSSSGSLVHIGQMFFEESLNTQVSATSPYSTNTNSRTTNSQDGIFSQSNANGNDAVVDASLLGSSISSGL